MASQPSSGGIETLQKALQGFAEERDWVRFHSPKNLSMALSGEVGELVAELQWLTEHESASLSPDQHDAVASEMADVFIYLVRLADVLGVDLLEESASKLEVNRKRFPPTQATT